KELTSGDMECVYEVDGDTLKVAMYFLTPGRPKGFNAKDSPPGKGHIILIELTREKEEKKADEAKALLGRWVMTSFKDTPPLPKGSEIPNDVWTFDESSLAVTAVKGNGIPYLTATYELDATADPKRLTLTGRQKKMPCIYEVRGDKLKVAFT